MRLLLQFLLLCLVLPVSARNLQFENLTTEDGLSHAGITAITQDSHGFIWIGTQEGLNRYNGYEFDTFNRDIRDADAIADDWVWSLLVDRQGDLWVGTNNGGLSRFNVADETFENFLHDAEASGSMPANRVRVVFEDDAGGLWAGTSEGLALFDRETRTFITYSVANGLPSNSITVLYEFDGTLLVGTEKGLAMFDPASNQFELHGIATGSHIRSLTEYQGDLWIGTHDAGVIVFNPHTQQSIIHSRGEEPGDLPGNLVRDLLVDHRDSLWAATDSGLAEWHGGGFRTYQPNPSDPHSLASEVVSDLFLDRGKVLWVGTYSGIGRWNYASDAFESYSSASGELDHDVVTAMVEGREGELWVGSYGGGVDRLVQADAGHYVAAEFEELDLADNRIMALAWHEQTGLWIGTRTSGLYSYDPASGRLTHFTSDENDPGSISSNGVTSLLADEYSLWIGTYGGGLNRLGLGEDKSIRHYRHNPEDRSSLGSDRVLAIHRDNAGHYWIGTEDGGLNRFNALRDSFTRYINDPEDENSLSNNTAWEIFQSSDGTLWIGTLGGGISYLEDADSGSGMFRRITKRDGLTSDTVFGILEDPGGRIWISSNQGLVQYMRDSGLMRRFDRRNGLRGNEFNFGARLRTADNQLLFGGYMGIVAFNPENVQVNPHPPEVVITAASNELNNVNSYAPGSGHLDLTYPDRTVRFSFAGLDYASPDKNRYRYMLEGFDEEWIDAGDFRQANYTNLPSGDYRFRVIASNNDRVWNEEGAAVSLQVVPPPWFSTWAYALYVLIVVGVVSSYVANQRRKLAQAAELQVLLEDQVRERTSELNERNEQLETANEQLRQASMSDALTGLNNRRYLYEFLENQIATLNRLYSRVVGLSDAAETIRREGSLFFLMIDLDGFKKINDSFGHSAGDRALIQIRDVLKESTRESDTIIRWGGDEFLVVGHSEGVEGIKLLAERIRHSIADHSYMVGDGNVGVLAGSIGFALYPFNVAHPRMFTWEQVVALADQAAYISKRNGGNAWSCFLGAEDTQRTDVALLQEDPARVVSYGKVSFETSLEGAVNLDPAIPGSGSPVEDSRLADTT